MVSSSHIVNNYLAYCTGSLIRRFETLIYKNVSFLLFDRTVVSVATLCVGGLEQGKTCHHTPSV
jgi:hypothetical protein